MDRKQIGNHQRLGGRDTGKDDLTGTEFPLWGDKKYFGAR